MINIFLIARTYENESLGLLFLCLSWSSVVASVATLSSERFIFVTYEKSKCNIQLEVLILFFLSVSYLLIPFTILGNHFISYTFFFAACNIVKDTKVLQHLKDNRIYTMGLIEFIQPLVIFFTVTIKNSSFSKIQLPILNLYLISYLLTSLFLTFLQYKEGKIKTTKQFKNEFQNLLCEIKLNIGQITYLFFSVLVNRSSSALLMQAITTTYGVSITGIIGLAEKVTKNILSLVSLTFNTFIEKSFAEHRNKKEFIRYASLNTFVLFSTGLIIFLIKDFLLSQLKISNAQVIKHFPEILILVALQLSFSTIAIYYRVMKFMLTYLYWEIFRLFTLPALIIIIEPNEIILSYFIFNVIVYIPLLANFILKTRRAESASYYKRT